MSEKFEELYNTWLRVHHKQGPRGAAKELPEKIARLEEFKATWDSGNALRWNAVTKKGYCGPLTVRELVILVVADCVSYPKGLDTPLCIEGPDGTSCTNTLRPAPGGEDGKHLCLRSGTPQAEREICVAFVAAKTMDGGWEERRQIPPSDIKDERFTLGRREAAMAITCPFCGTVTNAHKWILTGRGKRCSNPKCRALFSLDSKKGV